MKFVKNTHPSIEIMDFDKQSGGRGLQKHGNHMNFPSCCRIIATGKNGSGKTSTVLSMLFSPNGLRFSSVYLFSRSLDQDKYRYLENVFAGLPEIPLYKFSSDTEIEPVETIPSYSTVIFDDIPSFKTTVIQSYFALGRHRFIDTVYICQSFSY